MRLIDADALIDTIKNMCCADCNLKQRVIVNSTLHELFPKIIDDEPTIEAEPVRHGRWNYDHEKDQCFCTECKGSAYIDNSGVEIESDFCPRCGAKME